MKNEIYLVTGIVIVFAVHFLLASVLPLNKNESIAVYQGFNYTNGGYEYLFEEIGKESETEYTAYEEIDPGLVKAFSLDSDNTIGKKFKISWIEISRSINDSEGKPTKETIKIRRITNLEEIKP